MGGKRGKGREGEGTGRGKGREKVGWRDREGKEKGRDGKDGRDGREEEKGKKVGREKRVIKGEGEGQLKRGLSLIHISEPTRPY